MRLIDAAMLGAILTVALIWPLRSPPIAAHGEAREGLVVQDIVAHDAWILPRRNGEMPSKPPLYHWIAATVAGARGGSSDVVVRLPSALAAAAVALATFLFAADTRGRLAAWLSIGALFGMHQFWLSAIEARVDMLFTACVTVALVAFHRWYRHRGGLARALCYLAIAAAVLTKGPAGAVLPALVIVVFLAREHRHGADLRASLRAFWSTPLVAVAALPVVAWYALAYRSGGHEFVALHFMKENADRFLGRGVFGEHGGRARLSMVRALATDLLPWNLVLIWCAYRWARGAREDAAGRFLHAWWIVILVFFTIAFGKRDVYLLPLYPAIALLVGRALATAITTTDRDRLFGVVAVPAAIRRRFPARPALAFLAIVLIVFDAGVVLIGQLARENRARQRSLLPFAATVATQVPAGAPLFATYELAGSDLQVLAYRLARSIARTDAPPVCASAAAPPADASGAAAPADAAGETYYLLPTETTPGRGAVLAESKRRGTGVALLRGSSRACDASPPS